MFNKDTMGEKSQQALNNSHMAYGPRADDAHHVYTYTLEVSEPAIQVDIRLDFGDSQNIEVVDDENVLREDDRYIVVGTVMPLTS